jgi:hypothetical protein
MRERWSLRSTLWERAFEGTLADLSDLRPNCSCSEQRSFTAPAGLVETK